MLHENLLLMEGEVVETIIERFGGTGGAERMKRMERE